MVRTRAAAKAEAASPSPTADGQLQKTNDTPVSAKKGKLPVRAKETHRRVSIEIPLPTPLRKSKREEGEEFRTPLEGKKHITFDDNSDQEEFVTPREAPAANPLEAAPTSSKKDKAKEDESPDGAEEDDEEDVEEESDDEAPEAISTHAAEAQTAQAAKAAAKGAEQQAAAQKRKRQERDAFLKKQAEEKKRTQQEAATGEQEDKKEEEDSEAEQEPVATAPTGEKRKRSSEVPKLLPLELLDSDDEEDAALQRAIAEADERQQKRMRLDQASSLVREPKQPKDKKVGSTIFKVVADRVDKNVAPKANKQSVRLKEDMMRRGRIPQQPKRGFFVK